MDPRVLPHSEEGVRLAAKLLAAVAQATASDRSLEGRCPCTAAADALHGRRRRRSRLLLLPLPLPPPLQLNARVHPWPSIHAAGATGALLLALLTSDCSSLCGEGEEGSPEQAERLFRSARAALDACCAVVSMLVFRSVGVWTGTEERPGGVFAAAASCFESACCNRRLPARLELCTYCPYPCPRRCYPCSARRGSRAGRCAAMSRCGHGWLTRQQI